MSPARTVLSIQSSVTYGHVGNSSAVFPMQRRGIEVWPVFTVQFSNHTGYQSWRGPLLEASDLTEVITGVDERGVLPRVDAVLSGYQGGEDVGAVILDAVQRVQQQNPNALYCCDPVMGDLGEGFYVRPGIPEFIRDTVLPAAQVLTPNHFELQFLSGRPSRTLAEVLSSVDQLRERGPEVVLVTSVVHDEQAPGDLDMIAVDQHGAWLVTTPRLARGFTGSGDLTAAMFLTCLLEGTGTAEALGRTASIVFGVLEATNTLGEQELALVAAQDQLVAPSRMFEARRLR